MPTYLEQYYGPLLKPFGRLSKPVKLISKKHIEWIKQQPCVATGLIGEGVDAHHYQLRSQIQNDYTCIPLRHDIHIGELHGKSEEFVEEKYKIDLKDALICKLVERIYELEKKLGYVK